MRNIRHPKPTLWGTSPQHIGFDYLNFGNEGYVHTSMKGDEFCGIVSGTVPIRIQAASQSGREPKLRRPAVAVAQGRGDGDAPLRGGPVFLPWNQEDVVPPVPVAPSDVIGRPYVADVGFSQCAVPSAQGWAGSSRDNCAQRADQVAGPQHRKRPGRHPGGSDTTAISGLIRDRWTRSAQRTRRGFFRLHAVSASHPYDGHSSRRSRGSDQRDAHHRGSHHRGRYGGA
jgi:hypothetical protein